MANMSGVMDDSRPHGTGRDGVGGRGEGRGGGERETALMIES